MDQLTQGAKYSLEAFKEPRGFIKIISIVLAIFAFATISSHSTRSEFVVMCNEGKANVTVKFSYGYHYALTSVELDQTVPVCNKTLEQKPAYLFGDYSSSSQFFVFVGVMAFLFSLASIIVYAFYDEMYMTTDLWPKVDVVLLAVWTLLWLIASSAWADGLGNVKYFTNPNNAWIKHAIPDCADGVKCVATETGNFANANVSVMFGFLCMFVWGGSVWFVMKETSWFKERYGGGASLPQQQYPPTQSSQPGGAAYNPYLSSQPSPFPAYPSRM